MIISRTPLRISFLGGGTDFPDFYMQYGGATLSTTIDKYVYVVVKERFDDKIVLHYTKTEEVNEVKEIQHDLIRAVLDYADIEHGIEITTMADIPTEGTGLGSSSSLIVGLIHALYKFNNIDKSPVNLAEEACNVELDMLKKGIGKQDQYIAAYGGLRMIFYGQDIGTYIPKMVSPDTLMNRVSLFYTGLTRDACTILNKQKANINDRLPQLKDMITLCYQGLSALQRGAVDSFGKILDRAWKVKKQLASGITNDTIEDMYNLAMGAGAYGCKVCGAGGGGFLLVLADKMEAVRQALHQYREFPVNFEPTGSTIIYED